VNDAPWQPSGASGSIRRPGTANSTGLAAGVPPGTRRLIGPGLAYTTVAGSQPRACAESTATELTRRLVKTTS